MTAKLNRSKTPYTEAELRGQDLRDAGFCGVGIGTILGARKAHNLALEHRATNPLTLNIGTPKTEANTMANQSLNVRKALLALMQDYTTVKVTFIDPTSYKEDRSEDKAYTYLAPLGMGIQRGDLVLVPAPHTSNMEESRSFAVTQVLTVDDEPDLNLDLAHSYKWVIQKLDFSTYNGRIQLEKDLAEDLARLERSNLRKNMLHGLTEQMGPDALALIGERLGVTVPTLVEVKGD